MLMPDTWLIVVARVARGGGLAGAARVLVDVDGRGRRQQLPVVQAVWPVTGCASARPPNVAIAPVRGWGRRDGLRAAAKADVLSLSAFEVGLFGWMAPMAFVFFPAPDRLAPDSPVYWFLMQIGMVIGFFTARPANVWLVRRGVKEAM